MNNRWRQIAKVITDKDERWEYFCDNKFKPEKCPCCGNRLYHNSWNDERGCVETITKCGTCNYKDHWSYGTTFLQVGKWSADYRFNATEVEVFSIQAEFNKQIKLLRSRKKRIKLKMYA